MPPSSTTTRSRSTRTLRTMHSWLGVTCGLFFFVQFLVGLIFLFPVPGWIRQVVMPYHRMVGFGTLVVAASAMLTGIQEQIGFDDSTGKPTREAKTAESMGLLIVLLTPTGRSDPQSKRVRSLPPDHEELPGVGEKKCLFVQLIENSHRTCTHRLIVAKVTFVQPFLKESSLLFYDFARDLHTG